MKFFLQNNCVDRIVLPALDYAKRNNIPFLDQSCVIDTDLDKVHNWQEPTVVIGSVGLLKQCHKHPLASKWIYYSQDSFSASLWSEFLKDKFFNHDGVTIQAKDVIHLIKDKKLHLRPLNDDKLFVGQVFSPDSWLVHKTDRDVPDEAPVWATLPKQIDEEIRSWIIDGEVISATTYRLNGEAHWKRVTDQSILSTIKSLAKIFVPEKMCVMDVVRVGEEYSVLEYNPIHGSGWYDADVDAILDSYCNFIDN